jgi:hypothetical protein
VLLTFVWAHSNLRLWVDAEQVSVKGPHDKWGFWLTCGWKDEAVRQRRSVARLLSPFSSVIIFLSPSSRISDPLWITCSHIVPPARVWSIPPQGHSIISDHHVPQTCVVHPLFTCPDCGQGQLPVSDLVLICCLLTSRNSVLLAKLVTQQTPRPQRGIPTSFHHTHEHIGCQTCLNNLPSVQVSCPSRDCG